MTLRQLAWLNIGTHLVGLGFAATVMREGFLGGGEVANVFLWRVGWAWWLFAAVTLVWFMAALRIRVALALSVAGLLCDLVGDLYWIVKVEWNLPMFWVGAAGANTLYTLGVCWAGAKRREVSTIFVAIAGFAFTGTALAQSWDGVVLFSGATILLYCTWCLRISRSSSSEATASSAA